MFVLESIPNEYIPIYNCIERMIYASAESRFEDLKALNVYYSEESERVFKSNSDQARIEFDELRQACLLSLDKTMIDELPDFTFKLRKKFDSLPIPKLL
jgi:hypothetical protein